MNILRGKTVELPPIRSAAAKEVDVNRHRDESDEGPDLSWGESLVDALLQQLPAELGVVHSGNNVTTFVDSQRLQRVKVRQYQDHCKVRVRCARGWGLKNCRHGIKSRNAQYWLEAIRVEDDNDVNRIVMLYDYEWGNCAV